MALIKCNNCGGMVSDKANACPHCGAPVVTSNRSQDFKDATQGSNEYYNEPKRKSNAGLIVAVVLGLLALLGIGGWLWYDNQQKRIALEQLQEKARQDSIAQVEKARQDSIKAAEKIVMMQNAYKKVLNRFQSGDYFLYDITGDGVPELWLNVYEDDGSSWQIHQFVDNQMILIHHAIDGICYQGQKSIIIDFNSGYEEDNSYSTYKVHYHDGKIKEDLINYETVVDYRNHKKPKEPKVKTYDIKNTNPIMESIK